VTPVALGVDVAEVEALLQSLADARDGDGDLARDEGGTTAGRLVVEEDAVGQVHAVGLAVVDEDPEGVLLRDSVGRAGVEGGGLGLGHLLHLAVQLGGGGLVEAAGLLEAAGADGVEHAEDTNTVAVGGVLRHVERNLDVGHGAEVVDLIGLDVGDDGDEVGGVAEVTVVEEELDSALVAVAVDVVDAAGVEGRRTTDDAVDRVALRQQKFRQVRAVLAGDSSDESNFSCVRHLDCMRGRRRGGEYGK